MLKYQLAGGFRSHCSRLAAGGFSWGSHRTGARGSGGAGPRAVALPPGRRTGRSGAAEWALYPLADDVRAGVEPDHMRDIEAAIGLARANGTFRGSEHFVTRLEGDVGALVETVVGAWARVGRSVQHVTSHVTFSLNSPTRSRG